MKTRTAFLSLWLIAILGAAPTVQGAKKAPQCKEKIAEEASLPPLSLPTYRNPLKKAVVALIKEQLGEMEESQIESLLEVPPRPELGQVAFPCFLLAKQMKKAPAQIAIDLAKEMSVKKGPFISRVEAAGPYVNFAADFTLLGQEIIAGVLKGTFFHYGFEGSAKKERIDIEFSQPNTHKALHVGHVRNMVYGESVARLLEQVGHGVVRTTYPGDMGAHVGKLIWYVQKYRVAELSTLVPSERADWLGKMYVNAEAEIRSKDGTPEAEATKKEIEEVLQKIESGSGPLHDLYRTTREWSLEEMRRTYSWLGISFDRWYFESECDLPSRELVEKKLAEGFFTRSQGAVGIDLKDHGLPYAMVLTSGGNGLYLTKDLELLRRKFLDPETTRSIVVVDDRQKLHFQQVFKIAELMGYRQAKRSIHLAYATVNASDGAPFSSRTMNGANLGVVKKEAVDTVMKLLEQKYGRRVAPAFADAVATAALKFGFLRVDANASIAFDLSGWLKPEGYTAVLPILLYMQMQDLISQGQVQEAFTTPSDTEVALLNQLFRFPEVALEAVRFYRPSLITQFINNLSEPLSKYLREGRTQRSLLITATRISEEAFKLLGVSLEQIQKRRMELSPKGEN